MADWLKITMVDGWKIHRDESGYTLSAQLYAKSRDALPKRGDPVTTSAASTCAVPPEYVKYIVAEVETTPLSSCGPFVAEVTCRSHISANANPGKDSLLYQTSVIATYQEFHVDPWMCYLKKRKENDGYHGSRISAYVETSLWRSAFDNDQDGSKWLSTSTSVAYGCPFRRRPHARFADQTVPFILVTVSFNRLEGSGLEDWANFQGVVPVSSMPDWIKIPRGDNRWRLWNETFTMSKDTNGARILQVKRDLLGIPSNFTDVNGDRCQWDPDTLGQKPWGSLI